MTEEYTDEEMIIFAKASGNPVIRDLVRRLEIALDEIRKNTQDNGEYYEEY